jgi:hypothetical protein
MSEVKELREATRHAHEAIKDLRGVIREANETVAEVQKIMHDSVNDRLDAEVARGLEEYKTALSAAIEDATDRVFKRFDYLAELLMGEDKKSRRKRQKSIPDFISEMTGTEI